MAIPLYLAMTAAEFQADIPLPDAVAWMACHFSPYGTGLSNCPTSLPEGAMLIVNDRTPIHGHSPELVCSQLQDLVSQFHLDKILLDFQRTGEQETQALVEILAGQLSCAVAVSEAYAGEGNYPVFLPPPPLHIPLKDYLAPWVGREIWLEAAAMCSSYNVTEKGCRIFTELPVDSDTLPHQDTDLHCRYRLDIQSDSACFLLQRTKEEVSQQLQEAEALGVTTAVGLYQELG